MSDTPNFGDKEFAGVGFPTPVSIPEETVCRTLHIPADGSWQALVMGMLYEGVFEYNWQQFEGAITREEAAARWAIMFDDAYNNIECTPSVPAPYWDEDSGDDADDEAPSDDQPWYGEIVSEGVTWREQVGIWAITGFLAIAATPAAAIAFLPFANRFVLAFKQHSLGAIVKVLIDGVEMIAVDTYAPVDGVLSVPISLPAPMGFRAFDDDTPVLWVMMTDEANPAVTGTPSMQVIRKRLNQAEVTPSNLRWDADCDCVQQSPDGGVTWVDSPSQDPRSSVIFQVPARTGGDPKCDSATQMRDRVKHILDAIIASSDILQAINSVVAVVAVFMLEFGIIIEAIWAIASAIFSIGTTTLAAALTDDVYDQLQCIFYCNIAGDGTVSADQFAAIQDEINTTFGTVAAFAINQALDSIGFVGLTNAGALGEITGDCDTCGCGWHHVWNACNDPAWTFFPSIGFTGGARGAFTDGEWVSSDGPTSSELLMAIEFPAPATITRIQMTFSKVIGSFDGAQQDAIICDSPNGYYDGTALALALSSTNDGATWGWDGTQDIATNLSFWMFAASATIVSYGTVTATKIEIWGNDIDPFGDNC